MKTTTTDELLSLNETYLQELHRLRFLLEESYLKAEKQEQNVKLLE